MTYEVLLTSQANADLKEIFKYIAVDLRSAQNAEGQLERLEKAIFSLDRMPERFRTYDAPGWRERSLRVMPVDNYLVFYTPNHSDKTVTVLRVFYGGRDILKQLDCTET